MAEKIELYRKYRPQTIDEMVGNGSAIKAVEKELENGSHVFLMTGPAGVGKTTLARIMAKEVGAGELSIHEINSAENRGIDTAREVMEQMRYSPSDGEALVWIFDECFHKDTLVDTLRGRVKISEVVPNEMIFNSDGVARVRNVQRKRVDVSRLLILRTQYGELLTTNEHLFYTERGFKKAGNLSKGDVLYDVQDMPNMWQGISHLSVDKFKNLRKSLWWVASQTERVVGETENALREYENQKSSRIVLPCVWEEFYRSGERPSEILFEILRSYWAKAHDGAIRDAGLSDLWNAIQREAVEFQKNVFKKLCAFLDCFEISWQEMPGKSAPADGGEQSLEKSLCLEKNVGDESEERNASHLEWETWRKRSVYEGADAVVPTARGGVVFGTSDKNLPKIAVSDELQSRYRESVFESCCGGGRSDAQFAEATCAGRKESEFAGSVRVEGVEVYKLGDKSESFGRYFPDNELSEGIVDMYDLEIDNSPTYYANGVLVHNCHQWLSPVQNSFLKALEDTPEHVYFFLCTTDPQKLIRPLVSRCSVVAMKPLSDEEMSYLLKRTARAEGKKITPEVVKAICGQAEGGCRKALKLLAKVLYLDSEEERLEVLSAGDADNAETVELCRCLLSQNCNWVKLAEVIKNLDMSEPERIRQAVMGYMSAVLLKGKMNHNAACALQAFSNADTFRNGKFGISVACLDFLELLGQ